MNQRAPQVKSSETLPALETICSQCHGTGGWYNDTWDRCDFCNGAGFIPTPDGERVLALMRHNFKPMLEDATC